MVLRYSLILILGFFLSCGGYSFTGASVPAEAKTLSITQFYNNALLGPSDIGNLFSEKLREYFGRNTSLDLVPQEGDIQLSGQIESFVLSPVAPTATGGTLTNYTALTRLTVAVSVTFVNVHDKTFEFSNKSFSFFVDFDQNTINLATNERRLTEEVMDQIVIDIFNQSLANW